MEEIMQQVMGAMFLGSMGGMNFDESYEIPDLGEFSLESV